TQTLFSASMISESLLLFGKDKPEEFWKRLRTLHDLNRAAIAEMRTLLVELRPDYLPKLDLPSQLEELARAIKGRKQIAVEVTIREGDPMPPEVHIAMYRIAQEALNNIVKHSQASEATILLDIQTDRVVLTITDNGVGFNPHQNLPKGMGMNNMRER